MLAYGVDIYLAVVNNVGVDGLRAVINTGGGVTVVDDVG